jgi:(2R)-sulfolactate sulfo-lyase subunit alpha
MIHVVLHHARDNVAVAVVEGIQSGMALTAWLMDEDRLIEITAADDVPIGHKVALRDLAPGETVTKYGEDIGKVVAPIRAGGHAHVHNVKTKRW